MLALVVLWFVHVSRPGTRERGCLEGCARPAPGGGTLRVVSLNMLHGFPRFDDLQERLDSIAGEINTLQADIVLLQEVPWTVKTGYAAAYLAERTGMNYVYLRANGNRWTILFEEGEAILSRYPLTDPTFVELRPRAGFFEHRVALRATTLTPYGEVDLFVTHLTNGDAGVNREQARALMAFVGQRPSTLAIIAGDFNAQPDSPQIQALSQTWQDVTMALSLPSSEPTCCVDDLHQPPGEPYRQRIDYVFLAGDWVVHRVERVFDQPRQTSTGWLWPSDHAGILVVVTAGD